MKAKITFGNLIFPDAEGLDFAGPLEVFGLTAELGQACEIVVIGKTLAPVRCAHQMRVLPDYTIHNAPALALLIMPGGKGARRHARNQPQILEFVRRQSGMVASVCTGAVVLAAAGVLDEIEATTHYAHFDLLREYDRVIVREGSRFVIHDRIATSAGVSAGIDLSLALVARFFGSSVAEEVAQNLEWESAPWRIA